MVRSDDPEEIFKTLPKTPETPNDLWRGQTDALRGWAASREKHDVLISLNTGAGKTLVGLLIAQSLVNEGIENVVYVCSTNDLVLQTHREAGKIGIQCSLRISVDFSNDFFETGRSFCITNYAAVIQPFSIFNRHPHRAGAYIFDDAHVGESWIRSAFTIVLADTDFKGINNELAVLFSDDFKDANQFQRFQEIRQSRVQDYIMTPPGSAYRHHASLADILSKARLGDHERLRYAWHHLKDHLSQCAVTFGPGAIELTPPFLPSLALPALSRSDVRRVYLSATLRHKSDFVRAFGRLPDEVISPRSDAGEGERLVLYSSLFPKGLDAPSLVRELARHQKVLISIPSKLHADRWATFAKPPTTERFTEELQTFRSQKTGIFVLLSRFDGIDLPDEQCRIMIMDGLPTGANLTERFLWSSVGIQSLFTARIANRVTQLFGRINRGRRDYGVFIATQPDLIHWLRKDRNIALFPETLQKQVLLANHLASEINFEKPKDVTDLIDKVLTRAKDWLNFYSESIASLEIAKDEGLRASNWEKALTSGGLAEAKFALSAWQADFKQARNELESVIDEVTRADHRVAAWYRAWIGACYEAEGDIAAADEEFDEIRRRIGVGFPLCPRRAALAPDEPGPKPSLPEKAALYMLLAPTTAKFRQSMSKLRRALSPLAEPGTSAFSMEEAIRALGEAFGFDSTRPDNEGEGGPDILWRDPIEKTCLGIEAKTDKKAPATYNTEEIGKGHSYLAWIREKYSGDQIFGLTYVGPAGRCTDRATPSDDMYHVEPAVFADLANKWTAGLEDLWKEAPLGRQMKCRAFVDNGGFKLSALARLLCKTRLRGDE